VVTSDASAMPEVAGGAALLADPRDEEGLARQIAAILGDDRMAQDLRQRRLVRAGEMRWEHFAEANLALYKRVLAKGRG
jgi:glycosyltransferase involved in cell wall biosynthesis